MKKINNVSSEAVENATGKSWDEWLKIIDKTGGEKKDHKEIVAFLNKNYQVSSWWQQMITVGYEHARGKRVVGETADSGFQLGVQRSVAIPKDEVWEILTSSQGVKKWLGETSVSIKKGEVYETKDGTMGEIRVVRPTDRIRLTWKPSDWEKSSTLQISLICPRNTKNKTTVNFHHEKLPGKKYREELKVHWKQVLSSLFKV